MGAHEKKSEATNEQGSCDKLSLKSKKKRSLHGKKLKTLINAAKDIAKQKKPLTAVAHLHLKRKSKTKIMELKAAEEVFTSTNNLLRSALEPNRDFNDKGIDKSFTLDLGLGQKTTLRGCCRLQIISGEININCFEAAEGTELEFVCPSIGGMQINLQALSDISQVRVSKLDFLELSAIQTLTRYHEFKKLFIFDDNNSDAFCSTDTDLHCPLDDKVENFILKAVEDQKNSKRTKFCICGTKNTGKSTTGLFIANLLLTSEQFESVIWLDVDIGQPEFTLPGCVSVLELTEPVFGPSFCHMRKPAISYFVGAVNIADVLIMYLNAVESAIEFVNKNFKSSIPVIFNMPGWLEIGLGFEITSNVIRILQPTHTVQFIVEGTNVVEMDPHTVMSCSNLRPNTALGDVNFELLAITLTRPHKATRSQNASNERQLRCLTHFHQKMESLTFSGDNHEQKTSITLLDFPRKSVSYVGKVLEVCPINASFNPKLILMALNATLVSFCKLEEGSSFVNPISVDDGAFQVATEECQKKNLRIVIGFGILTGE